MTEQTHSRISDVIPVRFTVAFPVRLSFTKKLSRLTPKFTIFTFLSWYLPPFLPRLFLCFFGLDCLLGFIFFVWCSSSDSPRSYYWPTASISTIPDSFADLQNSIDTNLVWLTRLPCAHSAFRCLLRGRPMRKAPYIIVRHCHFNNNLHRSHSNIFAAGGVALALNTWSSHIQHFWILLW